MTKRPEPTCLAWPEPVEIIEGLLFINVCERNNII